MARGNGSRQRPPEECGGGPWCLGDGRREKAARHGRPVESSEVTGGGSAMIGAAL